MPKHATVESAETEPEKTDGEIAAVAKALAHPARVRMLRFLLTRPGCIGGDIVAEVGLAQSTVSEHLRLLKEAGLIIGEIEHPRVCYRLAPDAVEGLRGLLNEIAQHSDDGSCFRQSPQPAGGPEQ